MKLKQLKANQTELELNDGTIIFFSYNTPVAALQPKSGYIRTSKKWSVTTSKHINQWLEGVNAREVSQEELNTLAA